ncbi:MAG: SAM-dependent chlorinase/fluorinase [Bacteroidales bacterium]|nr:SAM-dependent chlorinase/fluorinase [Bacteroidales bacterium]
MAVVTLTTEWRADDYYFGIVRGTLERLIPVVSVVVNASSVPALNVAHAAFVLRNTFHHYPEGSVHLIFVHTEASAKARHLLVKARGHYFIGTDTGIFNLLLNGEPEMVNQIGEGSGNDDLILFAETAAAIIGGTGAGEIGKPADKIRDMVPLRATIDANAVNGSVIFIDSYGNAITNITRDTFARVFSDKGIVIFIQSNKHRVDNISTNYNDVPVGDLLARFNSLDLLEISINGSNVSELFRLEAGSVVRITSIDDASGGTGLFT